MARMRAALSVVLCAAGAYAVGGSWLWPHSRFGFWTSTILLIAGPLCGGVLAIGRAVALPGRARCSWLLLGAGSCSWAAGQAMYSCYEVVLHTAVPFPGPPDVGFLVAVLLLAGGVLCYPAMPRRRWSVARSGLDAGLIMVSTVLVGWVVALGQVSATTDASWLERVVAMAYPAGDVLIIAVILLVIRRVPVGGKEPLAILLLGICLLVVADTSSAVLAAHGAYYTGHSLDIGWWAGLLLIGIASRTFRDDRVVPDRDPLRPRAILVPYAAAVIALGVLAARWLSGAGPGLVEISFGAAAVVLLLGRQSVIALDSVHLAGELRRREDEMAHHAYHDPLTGLPNRRGLRDHLDMQIASGQHGEAVLLLDLDGFKAVNDSLGHPAGDELLEQAATRMRESVRSGDLVARLGGDEFAVVLVAGSDVELAAQRLLARMREPFQLTAATATVTASIGVAPWTAAGSGDELLRNADLAMYRAKNAGRDRASGYEPILHEHARERLALRVALRHAFDHGEFELFYQPIVDLRTETIAGVEALLRWRRDQQLLSPAAFLPVLEESSLILAVGDWIIDRACTDLAVWLATGATPPHFTVAINIADRQLAEPDLPTRVHTALQRHGVSPDHLTFEITERVALNGKAQFLAHLTALADLGISLSLDDFGTGYASLSALRTLPVSSVKIDRQFIAELETQQSAIVDGIAYLADRLGLTVIAEGVETPRQRDRLRETGIRCAQGYLFAQPTTADNITALLNRPADARAPTP